jgi:hypothetical protein
MESTPVSIM